MPFTNTEKKFAEDQSDYRSRGGRRVKSGETRHDRTREGPARDSLQKNENNRRRGKERRRGLRRNSNNAEGAGRNDRRELPVYYSTGRRQAGRGGSIWQGQQQSLSGSLCKRKELSFLRSFFSSSLSSFEFLLPILRLQFSLFSVSSFLSLFSVSSFLSLFSVSTSLSLSLCN